MAVINDGGPAFPCQPYIGISLRDWFAGKALEARGCGDYVAWADLADDCYNIADAMLAAREGE